ncbi:MAG TPA: hypothetical protein PKE29_03420 [Phycisphaerales bacterium]|nr:hypothetical protein [Phycisphaerales bacterium]
MRKPDLPDSLRVSAGVTLLRLIGNEVHPGKGELPNPREHDETKSVWAVLHDPLQRLAALAESKSIDSTPLQSNFQARYYAELDQLDSVVDRLQLIECGPHTGPLAAEIASIQAMFHPQTIEPPAPPTVSVSPDLLDRLQRAAAAVDPGAIDRAAERAAEKIARVFGAGDNGDAKPKTLPAGADESAGPALTVNQSRVLQTMARFDASRLLSSKMIAEEMDATVRLSEETVRLCVGKLIESHLAERPEGDRSGARLNSAGRKLAGKIAD